MLNIQIEGGQDQTYADFVSFQKRIMHNRFMVLSGAISVDQFCERLKNMGFTKSEAAAELEATGETVADLKAIVYNQSFANGGDNYGRKAK